LETKTSHLETRTSISDAEYLRLRNLERRIRAIVSYYSDNDIAAHVTVETIGEEINSGNTVQKVWVNRKLVAAIGELRKELEL
jgi:hypothetical protein